MKRVLIVVFVLACMSVMVLLPPMVARISNRVHYVANESPGAAVRNCLTALYYMDEDHLKASILPLDDYRSLFPIRPLLFYGGAMKVPVEEVKYTELAPGGSYLVRGRRIPIPPTEWNENRGVVLVDFGNPYYRFPVSVVRVADEWRVDPAPLIRGIQSVRNPNGSER